MCSAVLNNSSTNADTHISHHITCGIGHTLIYSVDELKIQIFLSQQTEVDVRVLHSIANIHACRHVYFLQSTYAIYSRSANMDTTSD